MSKRDRSIDAFRGISIILMVFFTATLKLSDELPDLIKHNSRGSFHFGDVVLPMFLFASGLSLVYFLEKYGGDRREGIDRKIVGERFLKLALVGILLSHWSTRGFLEMDEVMLSAILFLGCVLFSKMDWKIVMGLILGINLSYGLLIHLDWDGVFREYYLGGYYAVPFYFTVMLSGFMVGRNTVKEGFLEKGNQALFILFLGYFLISLAISPVDKLEATPSFMMLSVLISLILFCAIREIVQIIPDLGELEYLGRKPIRYWIMMYVGFMIPLMERAWRTDTHLPLDNSWPIAVVGSLTLLVALWLISKVFDSVIMKTEAGHKE